MVVARMYMTTDIGMTRDSMVLPRISMATLMMVLPRR
jgi:hypothetical protein